MLLEGLEVSLARLRFGVIAAAPSLVPEKLGELESAAKALGVSLSFPTHESD